MSINDLILSRRTVHRFKKTFIEDNDVREALEAALTAPNHRFTFPWKFVKAGPKTQKKLFERAKELKEEKARSLLSKESTQELYEKFTHPECIVFCCQQNSDEFQQKEDYASVCCAIQNFTLVMQEKGYFSKWSTGAITRDPFTYKALQIPQEEYSIEGFIWVGIPAKEPASRRRPQLESVYHLTD